MWITSLKAFQYQRSVFTAKCLAMMFYLRILQLSQVDSSVATGESRGVLEGDGQSSSAEEAVVSRATVVYRYLGVIPPGHMGKVEATCSGGKC